jgi:hypothetical protein
VSRGTPLLRRRLVVAGLALAGVAAALAACSEPDDQFQYEDLQPLPAARGLPVASDTAGQRIRPLPGAPFDTRDWNVLREKVRWGVENRLDTLPPGLAVAALARTFVGTPYAAATLERPGPEGVVVNLRALDCVTFVENSLALTAFARRHGAAVLTDRPRAEALYRGLLAALRYRGGVVSGYESRLHYFSEWLADNAARGHLRLLSDELDAVADPEPIDFMSSHAEAYPPLADAAVRTAIRRIEGGLNAAPPRRYVPAPRLRDAVALLRPGDVIAATSTVTGLDVAHTGLVVEVEGRIHLLHAPLVGDSVEISARPLADRIVEIAGQDGIMAARPVPGGYFGPTAAGRPGAPEG